MSNFTGLEPAQRKSKQQASKSIVEQARRKPVNEDGKSAPSNIFPHSVYGTPEEREGVQPPAEVVARSFISNGLLKTSSDMYLGTTEPFAEILRCLEDRIEPGSRRYVSGLETLLKNEIADNGSSKSKASKEKIIITPLDMLACTFRQPEVMDQWTPFDVALFEAGVCEHRGFNAKKQLALFDGRKSAEELSAFFDKAYSKSDNWKKISKLINHETISDEEELFKSQDDDMDVDPPVEDPL